MEYVFRSKRHGGSLPPAVLFGQALALPIGICSLPVMIGALVTMLQGRAVLHFLLVWFPVAIVVAWAWTAMRLRGDVVELTFGDILVTTRTGWEVALGRAPKSSVAVLDVRRAGDDLLVTLGREPTRLLRSDWPDLDAIESACRRARDAHVGHVRSVLDRPNRP